MGYVEPPGTGVPCPLCGCRLTELDHRSKIRGGWAHLWCLYRRNAN